MTRPVQSACSSRNTVLAKVIPVLAVCLAGESTAQDKILEEVIVTSQKRAQNLLDVPNSVAAVTGEKIEDMGIENLEDLTVYVPNIHFTETGLSTQLRIRGIGSDNSQGFEQSVGVYKDGIFHGRAQLFRAPMFDMERVEIMRGPQVALFGKNSIAGALDLITAKPTAEFESEISASYETEYGVQEYTGFVSGPLADTLSGRIAVRYRDDPGYIENTIFDRDEPQHEEKTIRGSLMWYPSDRLEVLFTTEYDEFDVIGRPMEITQDLALTPDPTVTPTYAQVIQAINGGVTFDSELDYRRQTNTEEFSYNAIDSQTLRIDYQLGEHQLTSLTGRVAFDYDERCECDFTPANFFYLDLLEDYEQISQEIRLVSPADRTVTWLAGVFYQDYDQTFDDLFNVPQDSLFTPVVQSINPSFPAAFSGTGVMRQFEQSSESWAIFAEAEWHVTDRFRLTIAGRFTEEEKQADKVLNVVDLASEQPIASPALAGIYLNLFNTDTEQSSGLPLLDDADNVVRVSTGHNLSGSRKESKFTPEFIVSFDVSDDLMTYGKVSQGYKAGGFDPRSNVTVFQSGEGVVSAFEFEEESVTAFEIGAKSRLAGGRAEVNVAAFHMSYEDLQISQFDGAVGFNVGNANDTRVQGMELDGRWQIANYLTSSFGLAYLNFEYTDFDNGNCYFMQTPGANGFCDYTGKRGVYTPEWTLNGALEYARPLDHGLLFVSSLDAQWVDEQQVHVNLDPLGMIDPYTMIGLRLALESEHWELALRGDNLLDEEVLSYSANLPLSENLFSTNSYYSFVRRPRTATLTGTLKF